MTYTHLSFEATKSITQALCSEQKLLNTVLQSRLKKILGFLIKQRSFSIFSAFLALKKIKKESTKKIIMESPKKLQYFYRNLKTQKI